MTRSLTTIAPVASPALTHDDSLPRALGILSLLAIALIHLVDFDGKWHEVKYLGVGYLLLIVACLVVARSLFHQPTAAAWVACGVVGFGALVVFVVNRTVGLPEATDDVGNWAEPLGIATLFAESIAIYVSIDAIRRRHRNDA